MQGTPTDELTNNRAKLQNLEAGTHFQLRKLAHRTGHQSVLALTGPPAWVLDPKRYENTVKLRDYIANTDVFDFVDDDQLFWIKALAEQYLLIRWARTQKPELTNTYTGKLWRLTERKLNAMCDWMDGSPEGQYRRVFF